MKEKKTCSGGQKKKIIIKKIYKMSRATCKKK